MSKFPHCCHSTLAMIPIPSGVPQDELVASVREAYQELDAYDLYDDKRDRPGCCPHRFETDAIVVGGWRSPGCGWVDYQYWHFPSSANPNYGAISDKTSILVFSRSSNFLCTWWPHFIRVCCGGFCQCYGDGGANRQHVTELIQAADKPKRLGAISFV